MNLVLEHIELPIRIRTDRPMTDEELGRFCAENEPFQVERDANGELIVMSPNWTEGGGLEGEVGRHLGNWSEADGRGKYFGSNSGFSLADTSLRAADAAWVRLDRWNALTPEQRSKFVQICPDFVIEVRSGTDRLPPLREKMASWTANGAELAWLIDPQRKVVEIYRPGEDPELHENPTSVQGTGPVRGFELVMDKIWG